MMWLLRFPVLHDWWFLALAAVCSAVFGARGIAIEWPAVKAGKIKPDWLYCSQPFVYNFFGSLAGWVALYMLSYRFFTIVGPCPPATPPDLRSICIYATGEPNLHLLGWADLGLTVVAFLGMTGKLPETVQAFIIAIAGLVKSITDKLPKS